MGISFWSRSERWGVARNNFLQSVGHCGRSTAAARMNFLGAPGQEFTLLVELHASGAKVPSEELVHRSGVAPSAGLVSSR